MNINWDSILDKYKAYVDSDEGQRRLESAISSGGSGKGSLSNERFIEVGRILISYIQKEFYRFYPLGGSGSFYGVNEVESVKRLIDEDLTITVAPVKISKPSGKGAMYRLEIGFMDDSALERKSLRRSKYSTARTGDGIDNIISLMDTGGGIKSVSGYWETREDIYSYGSTPPYIKTPVPVFERTGFMLAAVESFNRDYGSIYNCVASISAPDPRFYVRA